MPTFLLVKLEIQRGKTRFVGTVWGGGLYFVLTPHPPRTLAQLSTVDYTGSLLHAV